MTAAGFPAAVFCVRDQVAACRVSTRVNFWNKKQKLAIFSGLNFHKIRKYFDDIST
jgi:hypothetical protein